MKSDFEFGTVGPFESSIVRKPDKDEAARAARLQAETLLLEDLGVIPRFFDVMYEEEDTLQQSDTASDVCALAPDIIHKHILAEITALEYIARHDTIPTSIIDYLKNTLTERKNMHNQIDAGKIKLTEEDSRKLKTACNKYYNS